MPAKSKPERKSERELVTTHTFDAPRELVWRAWTDPELIPRWWGPRYLTTTVETMDVRPGGRWRFVQRDAKGNEYGFHGEYREVVPPRRLVGTFEYEGMPGHVLVETAIFEEIRGKTKLTQNSLFENVEDLEAMLASGMEEGAAETMERFTELVTEMQKRGTPRESRGPRARDRAGLRRPAGARVEGVDGARAPHALVGPKDLYDADREDRSPRGRGLSLPHAGARRQGHLGHGGVPRNRSPEANRRHG